MEKIIDDKELGRMVIRVNQRAKRFVFRTKQDAIYVSIPPGSTQKGFERALEQVRGKLRESKERVSRKKIDLNYKIETEYFKLTLVSGDRKKFLAQSELGEMRIICPHDADFDDDDLQKWLRKVIEEALRRNAKIILPPRLYMLSNQYNLPYNSVKINGSQGRWGSCSGQKNINLSYFMVLLPRHLIDYVLLHELCHTKEMNHGAGFWRMLNRVTGGKAFELRDELKKYDLNI